MEGISQEKCEKELLVICWSCNTGMLATESMLGGVIKCPTCELRNIVSRANTEPMNIYEGRKYSGPLSPKVRRVKTRCQGCDAKVKVAIDYDTRSEPKFFKFYCPECGYENRILCCVYKSVSDPSTEKQVRFGFTFRLRSTVGRKIRIFLGMIFQSEPEEEDTGYASYARRACDQEVGTLVLILSSLALLIIFILVFVVRIVP